MLDTINKVLKIYNNKFRLNKMKLKIKFKLKRSYDSLNFERIRQNRLIWQIRQEI